MTELFNIIHSNTWPSLLLIFSSPDDYIAKVTIEMQIINIKKIPNYPMKAYAPKGDPKLGIIFVWKPTNDMCEVSVFPKSNKSLLIEALLHTNFINRKSIIIYCNLTPDIHPSIYNIITAQNLECIIDDTVVAYFSNRMHCNYNIEVPTGVKLKIIGIEHAEEINDVWPHKYPGSINYFKTMLSLGFGIGLIDETNNNLIGWIFTTIRGDLHALHIKENFRQKGFAYFLVKVVCQKLINDNLDVLAYIINDNEASKSLFKKCGFDFTTNVRWFVTGEKITTI